MTLTWWFFGALSSGLAQQMAVNRLSYSFLMKTTKFRLKNLKDKFPKTQKTALNTTLTYTTPPVTKLTETTTTNIKFIITIRLHTYDLKMNEELLKNMITKSRFSFFFDFAI